jgi:hypothetical protein
MLVNVEGYCHILCWEKYGLEELKRLALKKQGLQSGIEVTVKGELEQGLRLMN